MEGLLLLPPDRAAILNRSAWKVSSAHMTPFLAARGEGGKTFERRLLIMALLLLLQTRFVTLGEAPQAPSQGTSHRSLRINASSLKHLKFGCQNGSRSSLGQASAERGAWLCVYKEKVGD
jgi:hypothetical protein